MSVNAPHIHLPSRGKGSSIRAEVRRILGLDQSNNEEESVDTGSPQFAVARRKSALSLSDEPVRTAEPVLRASRPRATPFSDVRTEVETLGEQLTDLFRRANTEFFQDGMESPFSRDLVALVDQYGDLAANLIILFFERGQISEEVAAETLRWFGHMGRGPAYSRRRWLLENRLQSSSPDIREAAALGLASLGDSHALPYLESAIHREQIPSLRDDMEGIWEDLRP